MWSHNPTRTLLALPHRHQVQHVHALDLLALRLAAITTQLYAANRKERPLGRRVYHLDQSCIEVDLGRHRRDRHERRATYGKNRLYCLVEKSFVAIGRLFQDEHVAACDFSRPNLHTTTCWRHPQHAWTLGFGTEIGDRRLG